MVTNGHPMDDIAEESDIITYEQKPFLFQNQGTGAYREVGAETGAYFRTPETGRGLAVSDYDNDGDLDLLFTPNNRKATLLRNEGGAAAGHWITLRLVGVRVNRDAIGARVTVRAGGRTQTAEVRSASSYLSQNDMRLHFGLGSATRVDGIEIRWPARVKQVETIGPLPADQFVTLREGAGVVSRAAPGPRAR